MEKIKSVYDPKIVYQKRLDSAKSLYDRYVTKNEKDLAYVDKSKVYYGVKNSDKKHKGYYAVQPIKKVKFIVDREPTKEELSQLILGCNCYDFASQIEKNIDHKCKHVIFIELLRENKIKMEVKDLSGILVEDLIN